MKLPISVSQAEIRWRKARNRFLLLRFLTVLFFVINFLLLLGMIYLPQSRITIEGINLESVVKIETATGGKGSGFVVDLDLVLTAAHIATDVGSSVSVSFVDGAIVSGRVIASGYREWQTYQIDGQHVGDGATPYDWALIQLDSQVDVSLILPLGDSGLLQIGDEVWAIGYPGGQKHNVSKGIISGRDHQELRTDAPIDAGYSGGPLVPIDQKAAVGVLVSIPRIGAGLAQSVHNAVPIEIVKIACQNAGYPLE